MTQLQVRVPNCLPVALAVRLQKLQRIPHIDGPLSIWFGSPNFSGSSLMMLGYAHGRIHF